jgi:hypothetical protein
MTGDDEQPGRATPRVRRGWSLVAGALLAALLSTLGVTIVTQLWNKPLDIPFQYAHAPGDDEQDATLDMMLIKNVKETGWFNTNPKLNAPFQQRWAEWPMGGDLLAYTVKKGLVETTGSVPLTFNLFWLLTFPLTALIAFPVLRSLRCSWATSVVGAVLFSLAPYHFRNGVGHENLAFYVGVPIIVLACMKILGPDSALPSVAELRHRHAWWRLRWLLLGIVLIGVTGLYYLAFLLSLLLICAVVSALAHRRPGRLAMAALFGTVGLATSFLANLPTLLFRWQHAANLLSVPDRMPGVSEAYPLRIVELLSPVTGHRFGPFAALADQLYEPGRKGLATAELGLVAAIGFVVAVMAVLLRAVRGTDRRGSDKHAEDRRGWAFEARLGILMVAALFLGMKGGFSRALELTGLDGVRAWTRIAIVVAFAGMVVFARLLDRLRVVMRRHRWPHPRLAWTSVLVLVVVVGVLDQASPTMMPKPEDRAHLWHADGAYVASLERQLPKNAMVFQLPVVDFPEHGETLRMSDHDEIKEGYLHSKTLRWSAGGVRGRDGEWQWPASQLPMQELVRGVTAMGFSALTVDRYGYPSNGRPQVRELTALLGPPIATRGDRLVAWDLRRATPSVLGDMTAAGRRALVQQLLDAPRLYLSTDTDPIADRGDRHTICATGSLSLVNPGHRSTRRKLEITYTQQQSGARVGSVTIRSRRVPISTHNHHNFIHVVLPPGTTKAEIAVVTPDVRCASATVDSLPSISAQLVAVAPRTEPVPSTTLPARPATA